VFCVAIASSFCYLVAFSDADIAKDICAGYPDLCVVTIPNGSVLVTKKTPVMHPTAGPIYNPWLLITPSLDQTEHYLEFQMFFKSIFMNITPLTKYLQTMQVVT